ncbi:unnamed protein product [Adineta steineri]|uniref:DYW domain-containing protein n=1 Tax=Adineta steineri TaxID=433720 RepID=A0A814XTN0_9BILA|nr:unnamed protein product [Adineta steineri]
MQYFRRLSIIRSSFRFLSFSSSSTVNVHASTTHEELYEINKLMNNYNNSHVPIRTVALFEWMSNIINLKPDFICYTQIIRACGEINNLKLCQKIHEFIDKDQTLQSKEYYQLHIKLIYMYAKIKHIELAEQIFQQIKNRSFDINLYGTMFKGYNMNGQSEKTIRLFENEILNKKTIELDAISATCVLSACSSSHRLDIGHHIYNEVVRLKLLDPPNIRLATAIIDMYCNCGSIDRARKLFDQLLPIADHITYSILMKAYLSINQPTQVLSLFHQLQSSSSSISPDAVLYLHVINACQQLGLPHQAENIHRAIPSFIIEKNLSVQTALINMHSHCLQVNEAYRLFSLLKQKDNHTLANLIHGLAINGQGQRALKLFEDIKSELKINEQIYKMILYACKFTEGLVDETRKIYKIIPEKYKTPDIASIMVSILARASLFDEVQSFIYQYKSKSTDVSPLWSALFIVCYHSGNVQYAKSIYDQIKDDPFLLLLFSDMTNSLPSNEILNYFQQQLPGKCRTEIKNNNTMNYTVYEFHDNDLSNFPLLNSELNIIIDELKSVNINWQLIKNDLKQLFCGHISVRLAIVQNFVLNPSSTVIQLTKTKPLCSTCHEGIKQLTLIKQCDIILKDDIRIHRFHNGKCSCHDKF